MSNDAIKCIVHCTYRWPIAISLFDKHNAANEFQKHIVKAQNRCHPASNFLELNWIVHIVE